MNSRAKYDTLMCSILHNPLSEQLFLGLTYAYHADTLQFPSPSYSRLVQPFLVVTGALGTIVESSDLFVQKAKDHGANITYLRVPDDHYVRKGDDVLKASFSWLETQINSAKKMSEEVYGLTR